MAENHRYVKPTTDKVHVEMEGDSGEVMVTIAGYAYLFRVERRSDAAFTLTEIAPEGEPTVITGGSEW